eukprot:877049-Pleurochrysis_carterae.AAC.1
MLGAGVQEAVLRLLAWLCRTTLTVLIRLGAMASSAATKTSLAAATAARSSARVLPPPKQFMLKALQSESQSTR